MRIDWQRVAPEFEPDGSLRDIYVLGTDLPNWQRVLDAIRTSKPGLRFSVDGETTPLPESVEEIFALRSETATTLHFEVGGITLACHFFMPEEIELDFLPNEVTGSSHLQALLDFMHELSTLTGKPVLLTPENWQEEPIFRLDAGASAPVYVTPRA